MNKPCNKRAMKDKCIIMEEPKLSNYRKKITEKK